MSAKQLCPDVSFYPTQLKFLNVNGRRYVGKVLPEQIYVGSLFQNSNVNKALVNISIILILITEPVLLSESSWETCYVVELLDE